MGVWGSGAAFRCGESRNRKENLMKSRRLLLRLTRRLPLTRSSARSLKVPAAVALLLIFVPIGPGLFKSVFASHRTHQAASWTTGHPSAANQLASAPARARLTAASARADLLTSELRSAASTLARVHHVTPALARRVTELALQRRQALLTVADGNSGVTARTLPS